MIHVLGDGRDPDTTEIVACAFQRSFTRGQVRRIESLREAPSQNAVVVAISPSDDLADELAQIAGRRGKVILQGALSPKLAQLAGIEAGSIPASLADAAFCPPAAAYSTSESAAALVYSAEGLGAASPLRRRHLARFDFADEWNNLGYGRIGADRDRWSIVQLARRSQTAVGQIVVGEEAPLGAAVTLRDMPSGSVLWFARPVGPVDGQDWAIVEAFISAHRCEALPCLPYLSGAPHGCRAAVSMRLDCDEDIASARPLFELYRKRGYPLSLAIKTGQPERDDHIAMMIDVVNAGGSILSHSVSHAPGWGGSGEAAEREARESRLWLEQHVANLAVRYAVSPFHQNPRYVPAALARAGLQGFIGGSISSDPEYLMARGGAPPFSPPQFVSHSQSCMLHGDCMLSSGDPLRTPKASFLLARDFGEFFGFLDHPFSERYAYGWRSEAARLGAHADFLDFIEAGSEGSDGGLLFVNEDACLDFARDRATAQIEGDAATGGFSISRTNAAGLPLSIRFQGRSMKADEAASR